MSAFKQLTFPTVDRDNNTAALKKLWAAKMLVHVQDYAKGVASAGGKRNKTPTEGLTNSNAIRAYRWFIDEDDSPSSFIWVCGLFELDPERTRMRIFHGWRNLMKIGMPKSEQPKRANGKGRAKNKITEEADDE